ncbi:pyrroline-5-carboxylate reductase [Acholeplasma hippikon]|uniref:Pyrroline-5-carboxylate reductase n=1 Tax=Acholeplasma hippikon TaxID=264636 RepID=A0A449BIQ7_9MOLU|nr:pyrroline-5-carboxylate reductase [Acholeplasma hippikon]VEU82318.1 Pyrroline-5-carboxylate reductase [Acholeplasma hippikon]
MQKKIGFIGCGNMGEAILNGLLNHNHIHAEQIYLHTFRYERMMELKDKYHVNITKSNGDVVKESDYIILAVKPNLYESILNEVNGFLTENKVIISITPSFTISELIGLMKGKAKVIRTIPNTSSFYNLGFTGIVYEENENQAFKEEMNTFFNLIGKSIEITEDKIAVLSSLSGSSPALIYLFTNAFVNYAKENQFTENEAKLIISQVLLGASKMIELSNINLKTLAENVCSPNGSTIKGVEVFENENIENIVKMALESITKRFIEMTENK